MPVTTGMIGSLRVSAKETTRGKFRRQPVALEIGEEEDAERAELEDELDERIDRFPLG
jgi:hypothetical protein